MRWTDRKWRIVERCFYVYLFVVFGCSMGFFAPLIPIVVIVGGCIIMLLLGFILLCLISMTGPSNSKERKLLDWLTDIGNEDE